MEVIVNFCWKFSKRFIFLLTFTDFVIKKKIFLNNLLKLRIRIFSNRNVKYILLNYYAKYDITIKLNIKSINFHNIKNLIIILLIFFRDERDVCTLSVIPNL